MNFEGKCKSPKKGGKYWEVSVPELGVFTQGRNLKDALLMAADAVETAIDQEGFRARVTKLSKNRFLVTGNDPTPLIARWLQRLRVEQQLTIRDMAKRLGSDSPRAWSRYESGESSPTVEKLAQLLRAVDPGGNFTIRRLKAA